MAKGPIPSRTDVDLSGGGFMQFQLKRLEALKASVEEGTLVRSMAHDMTVLQKYRGAMMVVITESVADASITPEAAANQLADAVESQTWRPTPPPRPDTSTGRGPLSNETSEWSGEKSWTRPWTD